MISPRRSSTRVFVRFGLGLVWPMALVGVQGCGGEDGAAEVEEGPPRYADIEATIFQPACTFACHSGGEFAAGGLDMQAPPRTSLLEVPAKAKVCADSGWRRVVAGRPEESLLYVKVAAKIEGTEAPCGDTMPAGVDRPALSAEDIERVRAWIEAGALED